jgi:glucosamine-6-phosphate deaminase
LSHDLEVLADGEWAARAAGLFETTVRPGMRLCLPTGDTVRPFYHEVARRMTLEGVQIFLLDEFGGLPEGDPGRCEVMIRRDLIDRVSGSPTVIMPDVDAADPGLESRRYADALRDGGIDLALVGLGGNGHIGMNEPGSTPDLVTRVVDLAASTTEHALHYGATSAPTWGITVGLAELLDSSELWLLVTGKHKQEILARSLEGPVSPEVPASLLRRHPNLTVLADESASLGLSRG